MSGLPRPLVLASRSRYRAELLKRVVAEFETCAADVDETAVDGESPALTAARLSRVKALAVAERYPGKLVIGSDQLAELDGGPLGKPGCVELAHAQLRACSGRTVTFHTAVCLIDSASLTGEPLEAMDVTRVVFRALTDAEIARYLDLDSPFDCAGSFKIEQAGVSLFERVESADPTALIGLPLIAVCRLLRKIGWPIP